MGVCVCDWCFLGLFDRRCGSVSCCMFLGSRLGFWECVHIVGMLLFMCLGRVWAVCDVEFKQFLHLTCPGTANGHAKYIMARFGELCDMDVVCALVCAKQVCAKQ